MNWWFLFIGWIAAMCAFYGGFLFGKKLGHMEGHRCEFLSQSLYDALSTQDKDKNPYE